MREKTLEIYNELVGMSQKFKRKGKTMPYTSASGYMFSQLNKDGEIGIRLPPERGKFFIEEYDSGPFMSYGARMKDYVRIPESLHTDLELLSRFLDEGFEYVMTLEPK
jgi:hypothetical protein